MTDPEDTVSVDEEALVEQPADIEDEFGRPAPMEAEDADAIEQRIQVPDDDEDDYR